MKFIVTKQDKESLRYNENYPTQMKNYRIQMEKIEYK
jgi:hypothetical protein